MGNKKYTKEEFEMRGKLKHGDSAFDYSQVVYVNSYTPVKLTCNTCGRTFMQTPREHLRGRGCASCSHKVPHTTLDSFIDAARRVHGDKYKYDTITDFKGIKYKVPIICPKHGVFEQTPDAHIHGEGCPICWSERRKKTVCGVGINDYDGNIRPNGVLLQSYQTWQGMIKRCYGETDLKRRPTYRNCSVCDEWLYFSNFKKWFDNLENGYIDGYALDKDILVKGNKVYSPDACCFVPNDLNVMVKSSGVERDLPTGVYLLKSGRYYASYNNHTAGTYDTIDEAYNAYCECKEKDVKKRSQDYYDKGLITEKVYNALQKYKVKQYNI